MFVPGIGGYAKALLRLLPEEARSIAILAGGALRGYFDKTPLADIDLVFRSEEDFQRACEIFRSSTAYQFVKCKGRTEVFTDVDGTEVNLIGFAFGGAQETIERFDFRCCRMAAWLNENGGIEFVCDPHAVSDAVTKTLVVLLNNGTERTLRRIDHYVLDYGYRLDLEVVDHLTEETDEDVIDDLRPDANANNHGVMSPKQLYIARLPRCGSGGY